MSSSAGWKTVTVDDVKSSVPGSISIGPFGSRMKADLYVDSGVPVIRGQNISSTQRFTNDFVFVSEETAAGLRSSLVTSNDLVFPHRGLIGLVGIVPTSDEGFGTRFILSTSLMKLTCDTQIVDPGFVFYFFRSPQGQEEILRFASTVGTPGIGQPLASLRSMRLPLPPLQEQGAIVEVLSALDAKIELNRKMNDTLEALAEMALLNACQHSSEKRRIDTLATLSRDSIDPRSLGETLVEHFSLPAFDNSGLAIIEPASGIKSGKLRVPMNSVLVSKLNPRIPRVWLPSPSGNGIQAVASTEWLVLQPSSNVARSVLYTLFRSSEMTRQLSARVTGTTGSHQRVRPDDVMAIEVRVPKADQLKSLVQRIEPFYELVMGNTRESQILVHLRNTLLPKLVSGEIRIDSAEKKVKAAV